MFFRLSAIALAMTVSACDRTTPADLSADEFLANVQPYCGQSYQGTITSDDPQDEDWRGETIIADFETCTETGLRIPLHVGDDHSRTWLVALNDDGRLALRHQHNHEDGSPDALSLYGGKSSGASNATRQVFPADRKTMDLFDAEDIPESKHNIWTMEIDPEDDIFVYDLHRPERHFRVEFDLSAPVESPGKPW
ncbi:hypothetical protein WNY37_02995 [Henriciella sp. AS95]|uniref:hypothetical protein n=1 Tax=Henriciella sp. AS95 TaxID=3135782 RepID=UPI00317BB160